MLVSIVDIGLGLGLSLVLHRQLASPLIDVVAGSLCSYALDRCCKESIQCSFITLQFGIYRNNSFFLTCKRGANRTKLRSGRLWVSNMAFVLIRHPRSSRFVGERQTSSTLVELPLAVPQPLFPMLVVFGTPAARAPGPLRPALPVRVAAWWWPVGVSVTASRWLSAVASGWRRGVRVTV